MSAASVLSSKIEVYSNMKNTGSLIQREDSLKISEGVSTPYSKKIFELFWYILIELENQKTIFDFLGVR